MASKMATENLRMAIICNYQLKIDDLVVYPYVFFGGGGKEHIEAIKNDIGPLRQMQIQNGAQHGRQHRHIFSRSRRFDNLCV